VVVDASSNAYGTDQNNNRILYVPPTRPGGVYSISGLGTALSGATDLTVDASGTLYIADTGNAPIVEVAPKALLGSSRWAV
jgi:hypothetical protein